MSFRLDCRTLNFQQLQQSVANHAFFLPGFIAPKKYFTFKIYFGRYIKGSLVIFGYEP